MPITITIIKFQLLFKSLWTIILSFNLIGFFWFQVHLNTYLRWLVLHISFRNHIEHCSPDWNESSGLFNLKFLHFLCYCLSFFVMTWTIFPNSLFIYWQLPKVSTVWFSLSRHCFLLSSHLSVANVLIFQALETHLKRK